jgi:fermentation-respiration switch protein FrsA (DUF1100 family)
LWFTRLEALAIISHPVGARGQSQETPAKYNLPYRDVSVTTSDGLKLVGWYIAPPKNGALIILLHGYKNNRAEMLNEAEMLWRHGYGLLISAVRAHDRSEGERITFGINEMMDMEAWYQFLLTRPEVNPERIGMLGNSMGGQVAIHYAALNPKIKAVATNCTFASLSDIVETGVRYFAGLPPFPFAPLMLWWGEREAGFKASQVDAAQWIGAISPRAVFLMVGGADAIISPASGQRLYAAAGHPKELWYDPLVPHAEFDSLRAAEFERRVSSFFDRYLK